MFGVVNRAGRGLKFEKSFEPNSGPKCRSYMNGHLYIFILYFIVINCKNKHHSNTMNSHLVSVLNSWIFVYSKCEH